MQVARNMQFSGDLVPRLIPRDGFYKPRSDGSVMLPSDISLRRRVESMLREEALRPRLGMKGLYRGLVKKSGIIATSRLYATHFRPGKKPDHRGLISTHVITDTGVGFLVDDWDGNGQDISTMIYHGVGTGTNAENQTDTGLQTESTTALNPDSTRATGTQSQPAANQLRSVGTLTFDASAAITEHGICSAATSTYVLWDRSVFSAINVVSGDSIQFTYTCTLSAGG